MSPAIELRGVGKRYRRLEEHEHGFRPALPSLRSANRHLWALRDVNLTVGEGEVVGVLGHNGAGKTTLLRLLAGITRPTEGRVRVAGRIAPLISLGVGFHQEMSGRENVLVNGMLLGLTATEVAERFDSIVEFAELREAIDTPVKFYSAGMAMRLGFAVVIHVDPAVLLVDEILAVGDAGFQLKCLERLRDLRHQGAAIVMVSHAMHQIRQLCPRAVLIRHGRVVYDGDVEHAIAMHYRAVSAAADGGSAEDAAEVLERALIGAAGEQHHANYDEPLELRLRARLRQSVRVARIEFAVKTDSGVVAMEQSAPLPAGPGLEAASEIIVRISFRARLGGGTYLLSARLLDSAGQDLGGCQELILFVAGRPASMGVVDLRASMLVDGIERADRRLRLLG